MRFYRNLLSSDNRGIIPQFVPLVKGFFKKNEKKPVIPVDKPQKMCYTTLVNCKRCDKEEYAVLFRREYRRLVQA